MAADGMNGRYASARALAAEVEDACMVLEESGTGMSDEDKRGASDRLNQLSSSVGAMERDYEADKASLGAMWKHRLQQLRELEVRLRGSISRAMTTSHTTRSRAHERELLFRRASAGGGASAASAGAMAAMERERASLIGASSLLDELTSATTATTSALRDQRSSIKQVQAGILNILSSIGISHSLISAVRRRATGDRVVLWVGVTLILVLMFLVYRWTHGGIMGRPSLPQE